MKGPCLGFVTLKEEVADRNQRVALKARGKPFEKETDHVRRQK
jgi:hypothetical protein